MYRLESFGDDGAVVINDAFPYHSLFRAEDAQQAESIVVGLNRADFLDDLAVLRYEREVRGLILNDGLQVLTDRESQGQLFNSYAQLKYGLIPDTDWKAANGWQVATLEELTPIARAVAAHVRGCFRGEKAVSDAIKEASTMADIEAIDLAELFQSAYSTAYAEVLDAAA